LGLYKDEETKLLYAYIKTFIEFSLCLKYLWTMLQFYSFLYKHSSLKENKILHC
jgi:hypothetical protein